MNLRIAATIEKRKQSKDTGEASVGELLVISNGDSDLCVDWVLDSAYTFHICPPIGLFCNAWGDFEICDYEK